MGYSAAAMLPKQARGTLRKHITKPSEQVAAPPSTNRVFASEAATPSVLEVEGSRGDDGDAQRDGEDKDGYAEDDQVRAVKGEGEDRHQ